MKKTLTILLMVVTSLLLVISCSNDNASPDDVMAYVTFGGGQSRVLTTTNEIVGYDELYWFYDATKTDGYGQYGQTSAKDAKEDVFTKIWGETVETGVNHRIGPFSQGDWEFKLKAYTNYNQSDNTPEGTLVYESGAIAVNLKGGEDKKVGVTVSPVAENGKIAISDAYFAWTSSGGGSGALDIRVSLDGTVAGNSFTTIIQEVTPTTVSEQKGYYLATATENDYGYLYIASSSDIPADYYLCTVEAFIPVADDKYEGVVPLAKQTFGLRVYGAGTTVVKGDLIESPDTFVKFDVAKTETTTFQGDVTTVSVASTPLGDTGEGIETSVNFENAGLSTTATHILNVEVATSASADQNFQISAAETVTSSRYAVAAIDLTLTAVTSDGSTTSQNGVTSFSNAVTVTTYIEKGLSDVNVQYVNSNGEIAESEQPTFDSETGYDSETGKLTFKTKHFSVFYATIKAPADRDAKAIFSPSSFATRSLSKIAGIDGYNDTAYVLTTGKYSLAKDIVVDHLLYVPAGEEVIFDLAGHKITSKFAGDVFYSEGTLTINDSSMTETAKGSGVVYNASVQTMEGTKQNTATHNAIRNAGMLTINGGTFGDQDTETANANPLNYGAAIENDASGTVVINNGWFTTLDNYGYWGGYTGNGDYLKYSYVIINHGQMTINNAHIYGASNGGIAGNGGTVVINDGEYSITGSKSFHTLTISKGSGAIIEVNGGKFSNGSGPGQVFSYFSGMPSWGVDMSPYALEYIGYKVDYDSDATYTKNGQAQAIKDDTVSAGTYGFASGTGRRFDPYIINSADQLRNIGKAVDAALANEKNEYLFFELGSDIDLTGANAPEKGILGTFFSGHLEGNGHTITVDDNMKFLFTYFLEDTVLSNFNIEFAGNRAFPIFHYGAAIRPEKFIENGTDAVDSAKKQDLYLFRRSTVSLVIDNVDISVSNPDVYHIVGDNNFAFYLNNNGNIMDVVTKNDDGSYSIAQSSAANIKYNKDSKTQEFINYTVDIRNCDVSGNFSGGFGKSGAAIFLGGQLYNTKASVTDCTFNGILQGYNTALLAANASGCTDKYTDLTVSNVAGGTIRSTSQKGSLYYSNSNGTPAVDGTVSGSYNDPAVASLSVAFDGTDGALAIESTLDNVETLQFKLFLPSMYWFADNSYSTNVAVTNSNTFSIDATPSEIPAIYEAKVLSKHEWDLLTNSIAVTCSSTSTEGYPYTFADYEEQKYLVIDYDAVGLYRLYTEMAQTSVNKDTFKDISNFLVVAYDSTNLIVGGWHLSDLT